MKCLIASALPDGGMLHELFAKSRIIGYPAGPYTYWKAVRKAQSDQPPLACMQSVLFWSKGKCLLKLHKQPLHKCGVLPTSRIKDKCWESSGSSQSSSVFTRWVHLHKIQGVNGMRRLCCILDTACMSSCLHLRGRATAEEHALNSCRPRP